MVDKLRQHRVGRRTGGTTLRGEQLDHHDRVRGGGAGLRGGGVLNLVLARIGALRVCRMLVIRPVGGGDRVHLFGRAEVGRERQSETDDNSGQATLLHDSFPLVRPSLIQLWRLRPIKV